MVNGKRSNAARSEKSASSHITAVLIGKFFEDVAKNPALLACCIMPMLFIALYSFVMTGIEGKTFTYSLLLPFGLIFTSAMVPGTVLLYPMAEEREKHALRTLELADVRKKQLITAHSATAVIFVVIAAAGCFAFAKAPIETAPAFIVIVVLSSLPLVVLALLFGLLSRDQMSASFYSLPLVLLGIAPLIFSYFNGLEAATALLPTGGGVLLLQLMGSGELFTAQAILPAAATLAWIIIGAVAAAIVGPRLARLHTSA